MQLTQEQYISFLLQAYNYDKQDTKCYIIRRACYYIQLTHYKKLVREREPLSRDRAIHYGLPEGSYREYTFCNITDNDRAYHLRQLRKYYNNF